MTSGLQRSRSGDHRGAAFDGQDSVCHEHRRERGHQRSAGCWSVSLEMSREALLLRLLCSTAEVDAHKMRTGHCGRTIPRNWCEPWSIGPRAHIFIDDTPGISLSEMRAKARRLKQAQGRLDLIIVDYLQLMSGGSKRYENRTQEVSAISRGLKALAKELSVPVEHSHS